MENQQAQELSLDTIMLSHTNEMFRSKKDQTPEALHDLAASIQQLGVLQPIIVRPHPQLVNQFTLICGERRYRASQLAGKSTIPATIHPVNDTVALLMQITENIQRQDVHPLNEAVGYKMMLQQDAKRTIAELALQFGKSESYIQQRLKLNDLVREVKKAFLEDQLLLGHALILARLTPQDQREALQRIQAHNGTFGTVSELQEFVDRHIMTSLSKAPFDLSNDTLIKKAGACVTCPKRSGAAPMLFADIKEKDRCFDRSCFLLKCEMFLFHKTKQIIETEPNLVFLASNYDEPAEKIMALLTQHHLKPIVEYNDFHESNQGGSKVKGLWISGRKTGQVATVYLKQVVKASTDTGNVKVVAARIQQRLARSRELDGEKVYARILEALAKHATQKSDHRQKLLPQEEIFLWFIVLDKAGYDLRHELAKGLSLPKDNPEKLYEGLKKLKPEQKAFLLRRVMCRQYGGNYPDAEYAFIIRKIATAYGDIDIKGFEKEQEAVRTQRETRANDRIKSMQQKGKSAQSKSSQA
ncbi:MAG: ParB/RepB/Spo0J family partition protein [Cyclobacteriaceae bacterium]|nr:ParB/RepB/Spo0J family partition protein [Cyclobacteriaceae bacterium]